MKLLKANNLKCKVFWDVEDRDYLFGLGKEKLTEIILAAQEVIENAGLTFCLYTGLYIYKEEWFDFTKFSCPLWTARYPSSRTKTLSDTPEEKYKPDVGRDIYGWQYSGNGRVDGISTNVDLDILYENPTLLETDMLQIPIDKDREMTEKYVVIVEEMDKKSAEKITKTADELGINSKIYKCIFPN